MKKFTAAIVAGMLAAGISFIWAENGIVVHEKDGTTTYFPAEKIDYVEFGDFEPEGNEPSQPEDPSDPGDETDPSVPEIPSVTNVIKNLKEGANLSATAVVTAQSSRGLVLTDEGGSIFYFNSNLDLNRYPIGSLVEVEGNIVSYNNCLELSTGTKLNVVAETTYNYPEPLECSAAVIDAICEANEITQPQYVKFQGQIQISNSSNVTYYNILLDGSSNKGSVYGGTDFILDQLTNGNYYSFEGYYVYISGSSTKYFNVVVTKVEEIEKQSPENPSEDADIPSDYTFPLSYVKLPQGTAQQVKDYTGFTVNFNKNNHTPNYVAWELTSSEADGSVSTSRSYWVDSEIEGCLSTDYAYSTTKYERGHMCPAADQKWSSQAMKDCAVMTNMCPQLSTLNGGIWAKLEEKERSWASSHGAIWIVAGPIYTSNDTQYVGDAKARVSSAFFKAFLYENGSKSKAIAFVFQHGTNPGDISSYAMSIDDLEEITGYDFFPALPDDIEKTVEATFNYSSWN